MVKKLQTIGIYFGGAIIWKIRCQIKEKDPFNNQNYEHVLGIQLLQWMSLLIFVVIFCVHTLVIKYNRELALKIPLEISFYLLAILLGICLLIRLEGIISVLIGKTTKVKLPFKVKGKGILSNIAFGGAILSHFLLLCLVIVAVYASNTTLDEVEIAEVYMLYDDMEYVPRWVFATGFSPEIVVAQINSNINEVALIPLTEESLDVAINNGKLIYIAAHGVDGDIWFPKESFFVGPEDIKLEKGNDDLQYIYLSACDSGYLHDEWNEAFEPAKVITFDRLSTVLEHISWLLFEGPKVVSELN